MNLVVFIVINPSPSYCHVGFVIRQIEIVLILAGTFCFLALLVWYKFLQRKKEELKFPFFQTSLFCILEYLFYHFMQELNKYLLYFT